MTVLAANVTDQDTDDPPDNMAANYVFTFTTADVLVCGDPATKIHDVQGSGLTSPIVGTGVTIEGVVVGDYQATPAEFGGFYLQEEAADADANPGDLRGHLRLRERLRARRRAPATSSACAARSPSSTASPS